MHLAYRILLLLALLAIGTAFLVNAVRQRRRTGRTSLRRPDATRPLVYLTDLLFWVGVTAWIGVSAAWILRPESRGQLYPLTAAPAAAVQMLGVAVLYLGVTAILWGFASLGEAFRTSIDFAERTVLVTRGAYRYSRNPMAAGLILVAWGTALLHQSAAALLIAAGLTLANASRVFNEERQLRRILGREFRQYERRVPRYF